MRSKRCAVQNQGITLRGQENIQNITVNTNSNRSKVDICFNFWTKFPLDNRQLSKALKVNRQPWNRPLRPSNK